MAKIQLLNKKQKQNLVAKTKIAYQSNPTNQHKLAYAEALTGVTDNMLKKMDNTQAHKVMWKIINIEIHLNTRHLSKSAHQKMENKRKRVQKIHQSGKLTASDKHFMAEGKSLYGHRGQLPSAYNKAIAMNTTEGTQKYTYRLDHPIKAFFKRLFHQAEHE